MHLVALAARVAIKHASREVWCARRLTHCNIAAAAAGPAQVFVLDGTTATAHYNYLQDLANLNMPAGEGVSAPCGGL